MTEKEYGAVQLQWRRHVNGIITVCMIGINILYPPKYDFISQSVHVMVAPVYCFR